MDARSHVGPIAPLLALCLSVFVPAPPANAAAREGAEPTARVLWGATYDDPDHHTDAPIDIAISPDGGTVFVTGTVNYSASMTTVAYEAATGIQKWVAIYVGPGGRGAAASAIEVSSDGALVFVTGLAYRSIDAATDFATVAYDAATGTERWASLYDGPRHGDDVANAIDVSTDGSRVVVTGGSEGAFKNEDYATVAYDMATGAQLWATRYDAIGSYDESFDVSFDPTGGRAFVTGTAYVAVRPYDTNYRTLAYDAATGAEVWVADYAGPGGFNNAFDSPAALAVSPDGSTLFVTGDSDGPSQSPEDYATVAYSTDLGTELWASRYDGPTHAFDNAHDIGVSPDGSMVFVTGDSGDGGNPDFATIAYDAADGAQVWLARFDGGGNWDDLPRLVVSADGNKVVIAGISDAPGVPGNRFATFAYDANTGAERWRSLTGARHSATASAVAMSPDSSVVFVTGSWWRSVDNVDYGTVAYRLG